jgi:hypothetical protein
MSCIASTYLRYLPSTLCLAITFTLVGCGSQLAAPNTPPASPADVSGNWQFEVQLPIPSTTPPITFPNNPVEDIFGSLSSSGSTVKGVLHAHPLAQPNCVDIDTDLPFTGTTDSKGNLSLTSPLAGGVATITANILTPQTVTLPDGTIRTLPFFSGIYAVVGGSCAQPSIALNIVSVPNGSGTYTGTLTALNPFNPSTPSATSTVTATLVQSTTPDADGKYPMTGSVTSTGDCNTSFTFNQGFVAGTSFQSSGTLGSTFSLTPGSPMPNLQGSVPLPNSTSVLANFNPPSGCASATYTGLLNRQ